MPLTQAQTQDAYRFFALVFNAAPGVTYMNQIADAYMAGATTQQIVNTYTTKPQFQSVYPNFLSNQAFATNLVNNVVGNTATQAAKDQAVADIVAALNGGSTRGDVIYTVFTNLANKSFTDPEWGNTAKMFANKVAVAQYVTETKLFDSTNLSTLQSFLANVTPSTDTSTPAAIEAALQGSALNQGQTFTLTKDVATTTGTSGNDTFSGILDGGGAAPDDGTYQIGDVIDGGAGTDTLNVTMIDGDPAAAARADVKNVEVVNIRNISGGTADFGAAQISGATQIWSSESNQNLTVSSVANLVAVGLNKTEKNIAVKFADTVVTGSADALTVALNEAGKKGAASTVTVTNQTGTSNVIEALTVSSAGSKTNYVDVTGVGNKVKTITATGSAALEVTVDPTAVVTVDTSAATGGVKMTGTLVGTAADGLTVSGSAAADQFTIDLTNKAVVNAGAGNDVVALTAVASLTTTDSINGGDGTDVLSLAVADAKTVAANAARTVITGFETLRVTGNFANAAADNFDISKFGINSLQVEGNSGNAANTVSNFTSGATVEFRLAADQTNALNIGMKNATDAGTDSDTLNIKLNADLVTQANANAVTEAANAFEVKVGVDGINILNVTTADADNTDGATKATDGYILTLSSAANVTAINVSGDKELSFTSGTATNALKTLDATSLTGNLIVDLSGFTGTQGVEVKGGAGVNTVTGTGLADIITGGAKDDVLSGGAGNDKISGGDGKDTITGGTGADVLDGGAGVDTFVFAGGDAEVATFDTITNLVLGTGGDVLQFGGTNAAAAANIKTLSAAAQANVTAAATLAAAVTQVAVETSGAKIATTFAYGTDTYIFYNVADDDAFTASTDMLIKITGVSGALDASNITIA